MVPLVSIIIPTYNRSSVLPRSIKSALNQTYSNIELIVIDDASTDDTETVLKDFSDSRISYYRQSTNLGGSAARNCGIKHSKGKYIAFLDDDDEWFPEKIEKQVNLMEELDLSEWGGTYCGYIVKSNIKIGNINILNTTLNKGKKTGSILRDVLAMDVDIAAGSTCLFYKDAVIDVGLFDESFRQQQDMEFLIRFLKKYKLNSVSEPLAIIYGHQILNPTKYMGYKEKYLNSFENEFLELGKDYPKTIARHWLQVAGVYARRGCFKGAILYLIKSLKIKPLFPTYYLDFVRNLIIGSINRIM